MSVSERDRHELYLVVEAVHGEAVADTFMELLPVSSNHDFATRDDLLATATSLRGEMAELRGEMSLRFGRLERLIAGLIAANVVAAVSVLVA